MKRLTLCADDYAQSPAIGAGIRELAAAGRLSATSVMVQSPHWRAEARLLAPLAERIDVGLHFNLTHPFAGAPVRALNHWLLASQLRLLSRGELREGLLAQIDAFAAEMGRLPDFIDGHQHVHALPVVRDALLEAIGLRWTGAVRPYLRAPDLTGHPGDAGLKAVVLKGACRGFAAGAKKAGFAIPPWFGGLYSLQCRADYPGLMRTWLAACPDRSLLMCHPGLPAEDGSDPIGPARAAEYRYLSGDVFFEDCRQQGVSLVRFLAESQPNPCQPEAR